MVRVYRSMSMCDEKSFCCFVRRSAAEIVRVAYEKKRMRPRELETTRQRKTIDRCRTGRLPRCVAGRGSQHQPDGSRHGSQTATRHTTHTRLAAVVRCRAGRRVPSRRTPHAGARALGARVAWWHGRHGTRWITRRSLRSLAAACRGRYVVTLIVRLQRVSSGNRPRSGPLAFADLPACLE